MRVLCSVVCRQSDWLTLASGSGTQTVDESGVPGLNFHSSGTGPDTCRTATPRVTMTTKGTQTPLTEEWLKGIVREFINAGVDPNCLREFLPTNTEDDTGLADTAAEDAALETASSLQHTFASPGALLTPCVIVSFAAAATPKKRKPNPLGFKINPLWKTILMNLKGDRILTRRAFVTTVLQVLQEKRKADLVDIREGTEIQSMSEFVLQHFMFKFGTKELVQLRLAK